MNRAVVRFKEIAPRDIEIGIVDQSAVHRDQRLAVQPVEGRELIPRQAAAQVMGDMQIVEEEERPEDAGVLDDRGASFGAQARPGARRRSAASPGSCRDRRRRRHRARRACRRPQAPRSAPARIGRSARRATSRRPGFAAPRVADPRRSRRASSRPDRRQGGRTGSMRAGEKHARSGPRSLQPASVQ